MKKKNLSVPRSRLSRMKSDAGYIVINCIVNRLPSWTVRRFMYRAAGMKIGTGARIGLGTIVVNPSGITLGERSVVNEYCHLDGRGGLEIGCDSSVSIYSVILSASHSKTSETFSYREGKVTIGDRVWVGARATILDRTTIGSEAVISAGSVVKGECDEGGVYAGIPAVYKEPRNLTGPYEISYKPFFR